MKLSIIMPVYNSEHYMVEAVQSIRSQTWQGELELIIVDDQSTDQSFILAQQLAHKTLSIQHGGAAKARNSGLKLSKGQYILFMDADDVLVSDAIEQLFAALDKTSSLIVFGKAIDFISPELSLEQKSKLKARKEAYNGVLPGCALIHRSVFERCGLFNEQLSSGETIEWMMKVKDAEINSEQLEFITLKRRLHMSNTGRLHRGEEMKNYAAILRERMRGH